MRNELRNLSHSYLLSLFFHSVFSPTYRSGGDGGIASISTDRDATNDSKLRDAGLTPLQLMSTGGANVEKNITNRGGWTNVDRRGGDKRQKQKKFI